MKEILSFPSATAVSLFGYIIYFMSPVASAEGWVYSSADMIMLPKYAPKQSTENVTSEIKNLFFRSASYNALYCHFIINYRLVV